ncbi:MAG: hypothetical protein ACR2N5_04115 [Solirubrobacterales bacterium]
MTADDRVSKISALLHECGEAHHTVYRISDGADDDWASWYSEWLVNLSELGDLLGGAPVRSHLTTTLVKLDREFSEKSRDAKWEDHYAERLLDELGSG